MFGKNEIAGKKYFKEAPKDSLLVTSVFYTLQGEGPYSGRPAIFVRLAKCNLACSFCDTYFDSGDWLSFKELEIKMYDEIKSHFDGDFPYWIIHSKPVIVFTGGEPLLQSKALGDFAHFMYGRGFFHQQIESNGIFSAENIPPFVMLVISPKCIEKNGQPSHYMNIHQFNQDEADCLKFVMSHEGPYSNIPDWAHELAAARRIPIYISPMNIYNYEPRKNKINRTSNDLTLEERSKIDEVISFWEPGLLNLEENEKNHRYAAEFCLKHGYTFNLQAHLYAGLA